MADDALRRRQLEHENRQLRERVGELERRLKRDANDGAALGMAEGERRALWLEAERIAHVGTWLWNVATDEVVWSDELYRILGYDPEHDAASIEAFFDRVHPDDLVRVRDASARGIDHGVSEQVDYRVLRPDGSERHVSIASALLFNDAGELTRAVGTIRDRTEEYEAATRLREQADRLEDAARAAKLGWFRTELPTGTTWVSPALKRLFALEGTQFTATDLLARLDEPSRTETSRAFADVAEGSPPKPLQVTARLSDDSLGHFYCVAAIETNDGAPVAVRGVVLDVGERVLLEERLRHVEKMEALGQLSAGVAHDFNNLLTVIIVSAASLQRSAPSTQLDDILAAGQSAAQLTGQMLAFSRQAVLEPRVVNVRETIEGCMSLVARTLAEPIRVSYEDVDATMLVHIDPGQLHQIVMNLTINARDAMPDGGDLTVSGQSTRVDEERAREHGVEAGTFVEIVVSDTGTGMDGWTMARIFEPFFTTKEPGKGTGLGLASVFGAAKQNGGFVEVDSGLGRGSRFRVLLPVSAAVQSADVERDLGQTPKRRILLVEDDASVRRVVALLLSGDGHDVTPCEGGSEGVAAWEREGGFDLVVTDYLMPDMTGVDLVRRLRLDRPDVPVLILSGWGFESRVVAALGRARALQKPFEERQLLDAVRRLVVTS